MIGLRKTDKPFCFVICATKISTEAAFQIEMNFTSEWPLGKAKSPPVLSVARPDPWHHARSPPWPAARHNTTP